MHPAEIRDLLEGQSGILDQPNRGRLGHERQAHSNSFFFQWFPAMAGAMAGRGRSSAGLG
jgi:hypothetical protein